ncbi:MAG: hypothetical protein J6S67_03930 [Methanobrevibacter sp.]|nr:hypothetical protein [Methanobrevibacter sp.]
MVLNNLADILVPNNKTLLHKKHKAIESSIKIPQSVATHNIKTYSEILDIDTDSLMDKIDSMPENDRKFLIEEARKNFEKLEEKKTKSSYSAME